MAEPRMSAQLTKLAKKRGRLPALVTALGLLALLSVQRFLASLVNYLGSLGYFRADQALNDVYGGAVYQFAPSLDDLAHYLINPRVHVPIFRGIFGDGVIPDPEFARACKKFDAGVVDQNTNDIRDELDKLLPAAADQWPKLLTLVFKLVAKGAVS